MNILKITLILSFSLILFAGCDKDNDEVPTNVNVEQYINLLKKGEYTSMKLPEFTDKDIPALLTYRNDNQVIQNFPVNPLSSAYMQECKLGIYVLWTIESIRLSAIEKEKLIGRFPSLIPNLKHKETENNSTNEDIIHQAAAKAYNDWWNNNQIRSFNQFKTIDPLAQTDYRWF